MSEPKMVRAVGEFREMDPPWLVHQDEMWPEDHPVVAAHPEWFDLPKRAKQQRAVPAVEQATAAPGEQRRTRRSADG